MLALIQAETTTYLFSVPIVLSVYVFCPFLTLVAYWKCLLNAYHIKGIVPHKITTKPINIQHSFLVRFECCSEQNKYQFRNCHIWYANICHNHCAFFFKLYKSKNGDNDWWGVKLSWFTLGFLNQWEMIISFWSSQWLSKHNAFRAVSAIAFNCSFSLLQKLKSLALQIPTDCTTMYPGLSWLI